MTFVYRHYDQVTLDRECNPSSTIPDADSYLELYAERSRLARLRHPPTLTAQYGPKPLQSLDVFGAAAATAPAPIHVFVHGGGWRMLSKDESSYVVDGFAGRGVAVVAISYSLLPDARLDAIAEDVYAALRWVRDHAPSFGGDPDRIHISGHSAGAHLAAMAICEQGQSLPENLIKSALLLSGNYELEPLRLSARNRIIALDPASVERNSPTRRPPGGDTDIVIGWGSLESPQYQTQGRELAAAWRGRGARCEEFVLEGLNHLEVPLELEKPDSRLVRLALRKMA